MHLPDDCKSCAIGRFTDLVAEVDATSACQGCPAGRKGSTVTDTVRCILGVSCNVTFCQDCPKGFYIGVTGQTECTKCSPGEIALVAEMIACVKCNGGKYEKENECKECLPGFTQPTNGQIKCNSCSPGKISKDPGSTTCV